MRTFFAIKVKPQAELLEIIEILKKELKHEPVKWVDEQGLHLTIKFLGERSEEQILEITNRIKTYLFASHTFTLTLEGLGIFKSNRFPRVLFVNINSNAYLNQLVSDIEDELAAIGIEKENRPFNPHLTIARIKYLKDLKKFYSLIEDQKDKVHQTVTVNEIIYYNSVLKPAGPIYQELAVFPLKLL